MHKILTLMASIYLTTITAACSTTSDFTDQPMPKSGFLPNYSLLVSEPTDNADARKWRCRKPGVSSEQYTSVILDPISLAQDINQEEPQETIEKTREALQSAMLKAVQGRDKVKVVTQPGPGVARMEVRITGAQSSADGLEPWNFTPVGLAVNAAAYAGGVNAKTPVLVVESKITDSQTNELIGEGLITVEGESFRTESGSLDSFIALAQKIVVVAMAASADPTPTN